MCEHWKINLNTYNDRVRRNWSVEKALTTPVKEAVIAKSCTDHEGNEFTSISDMCKHWGIDLNTYLKRRERNWDLKRALTTSIDKPFRKKQCIDHKGNKFDSVAAMCRFWKISVDVYTNRIKSNWDLEKALETPTAPRKKRKKQEGGRGKVKTYFIADTHFYHKNIIKYENRPFESVEAMNWGIIKRWNGVVSKRDRVFLLGDFTFGNREKQREIAEKLNGYKILVKGNHDTYNDEFYREIGFSEVYRYPILFNGFWILSHEPVYMNENMPYANLYGHVHNNSAFKDYTDQTMCVSIERVHMNYSPIEFTRIKELMGIGDK